jgi:hypothetical protein
MCNARDAPLQARFPFHRVLGTALCTLTQPRFDLAGFSSQQCVPEHLRLKRSYWTMETSESQERMPHVENVRLVKEAKSSDAGATGFDGRSALLPFGIAVSVLI